MVIIRILQTKNMLTIKEVSKMLSVEPQTVRKYINEGLGKKGEKETLKATKLKHGARMEWGIKHIDLVEFKEKYLI